MKAFISLRVSTQRQASEGVSLGTPEDPGFQEAKCRELCRLRGWEVAAVYSDAASGRTMDNRDGLRDAVQAACEAKGVVVVYAVARLARSARLLHNLAGDLQAAGANLASATEPIDTATAMGKAFFGLLAIFAQLESDTTGERTKEAIAHMRNKNKCREWPEGYVAGGPQPYGWVYDVESKRRVAVTEEQAIVARIRALHRQKLNSYEIARQLTAEGVPTRKGLTAWARQTIEKILNRTSGRHKATSAVDGAVE